MQEIYTYLQVLINQDTYFKLVFVGNKEPVKWEKLTLK